MAERKIQFTTNKGVFVAQMFEEKAPQTTKNFIELTEKGFYDGLIFHRVIDGFMIQGGDPTGTGRGGPGYRIKDEFGEGLAHDSEGKRHGCSTGDRFRSYQLPGQTGGSGCHGKSGSVGRIKM